MISANTARARSKDFLDRECKVYLEAIENSINVATEEGKFKTRVEVKGMSVATREHVFNILKEQGFTVSSYDRAFSTGVVAISISWTQTTDW